ncbi:hypothetical protein A9Q99_12250 [Gammaproteobacteria bacterium 45_16_T64]|nr:hypothetical protein A9Q99_12250 [Gammaproteobacteria bacterium 45_16_T64]
MIQATFLTRVATLLCMVIALLCISHNLYAATVYKKVDENGNLVFSDVPFDGAEVLDVPPVPTINLRVTKNPLSTITPKAPTKANVSNSYKSLEITSPINDSSLVNTAGVGTVTVSASPSLQPTHKFKLLVNGESKGTQSGSSFSLSKLYRGAHTAVVQIVSSSGEVLKVSPPSTFYVRQHSIKH